MKFLKFLGVPFMTALPRNLRNFGTSCQKQILNPIEFFFEEFCVNVYYYWFGYILCPTATGVLFFTFFLFYFGSSGNLCLGVLFLVAAFI